MAQRKVRFYQIVNKQRQRIPDPIPFEDLRDEVRALPGSDAYVQLSRMEVLGSAYDPGRGAGARRQVPLIALDRITRDVRLRIERRRNYRPLVLADDETLAEPTFYSIFDDNVLGVMRNSGAAPGPASFRDYLNKLELLSEPIDVIPLADRNAVRALADVETLTRMDIAVGPDVVADVFGGSPTVREAVRAARENLGHVAVEVRIDVRPSGAGSEAAERALQEMRGVVLEGGLDSVQRAEMSYRSLEDGRAHSFDFIDEAIVTQATVELDEDTSQPTEASAAQGMAAAYDETWEDIRSALQALD